MLYRENNWAKFLPEWFLFYFPSFGSNVYWLSTEFLIVMLCPWSRGERTDVISYMITRWHHFPPLNSLLRNLQVQSHRSLKYETIVLPIGFWLIKFMKATISTYYFAFKKGLMIGFVSNIKKIITRTTVKYACRR